MARPYPRAYARSGAGVGLPRFSVDDAVQVDGIPGANAGEHRADPDLRYPGALLYSRRANGTRCHPLTRVPDYGSRSPGRAVHRCGDDADATARWARSPT